MELADCRRMFDISAGEAYKNAAQGKFNLEKQEGYH
jgi:hypothetical protein